MKKTSLLLLLLSVAYSTLYAQTAEDIVSKHIEAIGGKSKIDLIKSIHYDIIMSVMGSDVPMTSDLLQGKGFKSASEFNGSQIIQCYTDKSGWILNPMLGQATPQVMPDDLYKANRDLIYVDGPLPDYAGKGYKISLGRSEGGTYEIIIVNGSIQSSYFIDKTSYFLVKTIIKGNMMGKDVAVTTTYSDFRPTDAGIILPFSSSIDLGEFQLTTTTKKVLINAEIDPKIFEMPQ